MNDFYSNNIEFSEYSSLAKINGIPLLNNPILISFLNHEPIKSLLELNPISKILDEIKVEFSILFEEFLKTKLDDFLDNKESEIFLFLHYLIVLQIFSLKQEISLENATKILTFIFKKHKDAKSTEKEIEYLDILLILSLRIIKFLADKGENSFLNGKITDKIIKKPFFIEEILISLINSSLFLCDKNVVFQEKALKYQFFLLNSLNEKCKRTNEPETFFKVINSTMKKIGQMNEKNEVKLFISLEKSTIPGYFNFILANIIRSLEVFEKKPEKTRSLIEKTINVFKYYIKG